MLDAITASQIALLQDQLRLQTISQNISNMQTTGYKRQLLESTGFDEQLTPELASVTQQMQMAQASLQGTLIQTHHNNDIALSGEGYFEVQTSAGLFYTRRGDFHVDEQGELVTATEAKLLSKAGIVQVDDNTFTIDSQGTIYIDNHKVGQLNVVKFMHPNQLQYHGEGLYESTEAPIAIDSTTRVLQGFIEQSNVKSSDEMLEMVKMSRHFETSQRVMSVASGLLSTAINQLGEGNV